MDQQQGKEMRSSKTLNIVLFLLLTAVVLGIAVFMLLQSRNVDIQNVNVKEALQSLFSMDQAHGEDGKGFEFTYDVSEHPEFSIYKDGIIKCTKDSIKGLSKQGEEKWFIPLFMNEPVVKTAGSYMVVANMEGREITVLKGKEKKWDSKMDGSIINVDINKEGYVSVVKEVKGSKGAVTVFDPEGNEVFTRGKAESFILSTKIFPSSEVILLNCVDTSGVSANTNMEFTDKVGKPFSSIPKKDIIFPILLCLDDDSLVAANETTLTYFDSSRNEKWTKEFDGIYTLELVKGKYIVVAAKERGVLGNKTKVILYDKEGKEMASYSLLDRVRNIQTYDNIIALNTGREVVFIDTSANMIDKVTSKQDIIEVEFFDKTEVLLVAKGIVRILDLD